jgi:hypothetical protein
MIERTTILLSFFIMTACAIAAPDESPNRSVNIIEEAAPPAPAQPQPQTLPPTPRPQKKGSGAINVEVLPQRDFLVGQQMSFRVTTRKPGYLVLVDVDAQGRLSQIYPNMITLSDPHGFNQKSNYMRVGQSVVVPDADANAAFRFVAAPPVGVGMVVAILSDTPVQVIDLPDVPAALAGKDGAAEFVKDTTHALQIMPAGDGPVSSRAPKWTFATQFYGIK